MRFGRVTAVAAMAVVAVTSACSFRQATSDPTDHSTRLPAEMHEALASIPVRPEGPMTGYDRDLFGVWADQGNNCDTRAVLLQQTSSTPVRVNGHCTVQTGTWRGAYTGRVVTDASEIQVDHVIPLAEAWRSGAHAWPEDLRERFGNDADHGNLVPAEGSTNAAKRDQDPADWLPPHDRCGYVHRYVRVTAYWNQQAQRTGQELSIDPAEHDALTRILARCE